MLHKNVDRLQAEKDARSVVASMAAQAQTEQAQEFVQKLHDQVGDVVVFDKPKIDITKPMKVERDRAGLMELKMGGLG